MNGIILINKPYFYSSFKTLSYVRNILSVPKLGHGGTLDPLAVGMLPICLGESRKFCSHLLDADKHYTVTAKLGLVTTTGDLEGDIVSEAGCNSLNLSDIELAANNLSGFIEQIPPMYSALKHNGKPLYEYARQGLDVKRKSRAVEIKKFKIISWQAPYLRCEVHCSKGTYIRTLLDMLGNKLGVGGAALTYLQRDWVAPFFESNMLTLEELDYSFTKNKLLSSGAYLPLEKLFAKYNRVDLSYVEARDLGFGKVVTVGSYNDVNGEVALFLEGDFIGLANISPSGCLKVRRLRQSIVDKLCARN